MPLFIKFSQQLFTARKTRMNCNFERSQGVGHIVCGIIMLLHQTVGTFTHKSSNKTQGQIGKCTLCHLLRLNTVFTLSTVIITVYLLPLLLKMHSQFIEQIFTPLMDPFDINIFKHRSNLNLSRYSKNFSKEQPVNLRICQHYRVGINQSLDIALIVFNVSAEKVGVKLPDCLIAVEIVSSM